MAKSMSYTEFDAVLRHENGRLYWKVMRGSIRAGEEAGYLNRRGYVVLSFAGRKIFAHRIIWLLENGSWPAAPLDHKDGNRANNHPANLRLCTNAQNQCNRKPRGQFKGVTLHKKSGKFQATCGKTHLGLFADAEAAARAYDAVARSRYGEFARLNFGSAA